METETKKKKKKVRNLYIFYAMNYGNQRESEQDVTWFERADAIGEDGGAVTAKISGEERKPSAEKLGGDFKVGGLVV